MMRSVAIQLAISQIGEMRPQDYVGLIDRSAVECLKVRLQAEGLLTPIWLRKNGNASKGKPYSVIAGRHRLIAASELGWTEIAAEVRAGADSKPDDLRGLQLAENLHRRVLRPIERACFIVAQWCEVACTIAPIVPDSQQKSAVIQRWSSFAVLANTALGNRAAVDDQTAAQTGLKKRSIELYRSLYEKLVVPFPDQFAQINAHPLGESLSAMTTIAQIKTIERRTIAVSKLLERQDWPNITAVLVKAGLADSNGNRPDQTPAAAMHAWNKLPLVGQRAHAEWIAHKVNASTAQKMVATFKRRGLLP
ncbi:MAG: ParB N-terminal domain-containing protein [Novosphingobium sp.]